MQSELKLCKDCQHFEPVIKLETYNMLERCKRPIVELVYGTSSPANSKPEDERRYNDLCGKDGQYWAKKDNI